MVTAVPYLSVHDADAALAFYREAFGAREVERWTDDAGRVGHAEIAIGDASVYVSDEAPEVGALAPATLGGSTAAIVLTVDDADAFYARAVEHGAQADRPVVDNAGGRRGGWLRDPFGHRWSIDMLTRTVSSEELDAEVGDSYTISRS